MARGTGSSFGRALVNAIADAAGGTVGVRRSYTAVGWHAQISKLTSSPRGYLAAEKAGLSTTERRLRMWLAEEVEPNKENRQKIAQAYAIMAGRWPEHIERATFEISGEVAIGQDTRDRGRGGTAPLLIDGSQATANDWHDMRHAWETDDIDEDEFEHWFIAIIEADLGEMSDPPEFPGSDYEVVIS